MKRSKFTDEQVTGILREQGRRTASAGAPRPRCAADTASAARRVSAWKAKFGGLEVSDAKRLRALEEENVKLKRLLADAMLNRPEEDRSVRGADLPRAGLKDPLSRTW